MRRTFQIVALLCLLAAPGVPARAQTDEVPPPAPAYQPLSYDQLDQLLGPIALYPDPLIAEILPASTFPTQIVMADRYLSSGGDPNQADQQPWDPSVQALAHYPTLLQWMDQNLDWTTEVGQAFLNQQQEVMDSIQRLRQTAYNLGNLQSTPQQEVIDEDGYIEIVPVNTDVIYVPVYQPAVVYYQDAGPSCITFGVSFPIGVWLDCDFDWMHHNIIVWSRERPRPANWWHEPARQQDTGHATVWRAENRPRTEMMNRGDRGWGAPVQQPVVATVSHSISDMNAQRRTPAPAVRPEAPATRTVMPVNRPESNGAFIGISSAQDTRAYSNRGQQSMRTARFSTPPAHAAPVSRPAAPAGGGGGHGSGSPQRH